MRPIQGPGDLDDLWRATAAYATIAAWSGAGLFDALADGGAMAVDDLPGDPRAIRSMATILTHLGLLRYDGARWGLSYTGRQLHAAGTLALSGADGALGDLSRLDPVLAKGGPVNAADGTSRVTEGGVREKDPAGARAFMDRLFRRSERSALDTAAALAARAPAGAHVLDVGGGHGRYCAELLERGCAVTLFDRAFIVDIARERLGDRASYRTGDFLTDDLGGPYGAALLSNIVHGLGDDDLSALLARLAGALQPGGLLVLKDMFLDDLGAHPEEAALFGLTMLMYSREGRSYTLGEIGALCEAAGFEPPTWEVYPDTRFTLLFARRAAA